MGNGKIEYIKDIIFIDNKLFDKTKTPEMADEIEKLNAKMLKDDKEYILIGPGRWGTRDRFIGIPVSWPQISNAKIIIETGLDDFPLEASMGSHFFHNLTSINVGYLSIKERSQNDFIVWKILNKQKIITKTTYFKHLSFEKPLTVIMDGKQRISAILVN